MLYELIGQLRADFERHVARFHLMEQLMIELPTLLTAIAKLDADVKALTATVSPVVPVDLQPAVDAVAAIDAEVIAATPVPPPPAA